MQFYLKKSLEFIMAVILVYIVFKIVACINFLPSHCEIWKITIEMLCISSLFWFIQAISPIFLFVNIFNLLNILSCSSAR